MVPLRKTLGPLMLLALAMVTACTSLPTQQATGLRSNASRTPRPDQGSTVPPVFLTVEQVNVLDSLRADGVQDVLVDQTNRLSVMWLNDTEDMLDHYREIPGQLAFDARHGMFAIYQGQHMAGLSVSDRQQLDLEQVNHLVLVVHRKAPLPSGTIQQFNGLTALDIQNTRMVRITQANLVTVVMDAERLRKRDVSFQDATSRTLGRILGIQDRSGRRPTLASRGTPAASGSERVQMVNRWILVLGRDGQIRPYAHRPD